MEKSDFRSELERMHTASFGWALCCCNHRREEAEEVLQTAYLKAFEGTASFDGRSSLRTWFFAVIRRTSLEQQRRQWLRRALFDTWLAGQQSPLSASDPEFLASESESSRALLRALAGLSPRQREMLHLVFYQDLTIEEASGILNLNLGTARTHFDRGKRQLRKILAQPGVHHDRR
jgi:RNA polymerase sigma-70 factor (ECF subfamily)